MKKNILTIGWLVLSLLSCKAQTILPIEEQVDYRDSQEGIPETVTYIKDVNGLLDKYVGTWKGTYQGRDYEFIVKKVTRQSQYRDLSIDKLWMFYKITDATGAIVADNTWDTLGGSAITGAYLAKTKTYYVLDYYGFEGRCGQNGYVLIEVFGANNDQMKLFLEVQGERAHDCTETAEQVLPTESITLTKQ